MWRYYCSKRECRVYTAVLQNARPPVIDIKNIAVDLRFDWQKKQGYGKAEITFTPLSATQKINLDAGMLSIHSVELHKRQLQFSYDGGSKNNDLEIILDTIYQPLQEIKISITYHTNYVNEIDPNNLAGSNGKGLRFSRPTSTDPLKPCEIYAVGEYESNRYWFPCYDAPNDWRTMELILTVDEGLTAIASGDLVC